MVAKNKIDKAWQKSKKVRGKDPDKYRKDPYGNTMYRHSYGKDTGLGWEVDHIKPRSKGGSDATQNLQALNTSINRSKGNDQRKKVGIPKSISIEYPTKIKLGANTRLQIRAYLIRRPQIRFQGRLMLHRQCRQICPLFIGQSKAGVGVQYGAMLWKMKSQFTMAYTRLCIKRYRVRTEIWEFLGF